MATECSSPHPSWTGYRKKSRRKIKRDLTDKRRGNKGKLGRREVERTGEQKCEKVE